VNCEILKYIERLGFSVYIAARYDTGIEYLNASGFDSEKGLVYFKTARKGVYTAVSDALENSFPLVTHWNQSLNGGMGGYSPGSSDALCTMDLDPETGQFKRDFPIIDLDPASPYSYHTDKYALLSSGTGMAASDGTATEPQYYRVPGFERYIGEGYSIVKAADIMPVWFSDKVLQATGYPAVFLNYPGYELKEGLPAFQILCNYIVAYKPERPSLATFLFPPNWERCPKEPYPVLFTGFYDNTDNLFFFSGIPFVQIISKTMDETGKPSIGIIWNGGGALGTRTFHLSAYHNISHLFDIAKREFSADITRILAMGGSRGGITALGAAGNPYHDNYRIKYALAYNPVIKFGDRDVPMANPVCPAMYIVVSDDTGYKYAWRKDWRDPDTGLNGDQLLLNNLIGTMDRNVANEVLSPLSMLFAKSMKERGTKVFISAGTHDPFNTRDSIIDLAESLLEHGVDVHLQIGYRYGHNGVENAFDRTEEVFRKMLLDEDVTFGGVSHIKRAGTNLQDWAERAEFSTDRQPVFFEGPKQIAINDRASISIVGSAGMGYHLKLFKIDDPMWLEKREAVKLDSGITLFKGILPEKTKHLDNKISYFKSFIELDDSYAEGYYLYELWFAEEGTDNWIQIPSHMVPQPGAETYPILQVAKEYPVISGTEYAQSLLVSGIGWGLSEV